MRLVSTIPIGLFYLSLLLLFSFPAHGDIKTASPNYWSTVGISPVVNVEAKPVHPDKKTSVSKPIANKLGGRVTLVNEVKDLKLDPVEANMDAYVALKSGQSSHSLLDLSATQQVLFQDDFTHPESMARRWTWSANEGVLNYQNHCLELSAKGYRFPVIQTLNDPFPVTGDWTVSIGYKYTGETVCGTDLKICRLDGSNLPDLAFIHEDNNGQFISIDGAGQVWRQSPNQDLHVLTLSKQGSRIKTIMDGKAVAESDAGAAPVGFRFGNTGAVSWDATWTSQQIEFVLVTAPWETPTRQSVQSVTQRLPVQAMPLPTVEISRRLASPRPATTIELSQADDNVCCVLGDTFHLSGQSDGKHRLVRHALEINSQPYTDLPVSPDDNDYSFTWKPDAPGTYHLTIKYTLQKPYDITVVKEVTLMVSPNRPAALDLFAQALPTDAPVSVQPLDSSVFHPTRVEFSLDGHFAGAAGQAPFQAILPISKLDPGQHNVTYQAYDAHGLHYQGGTETITVPERITLALPSSLKITAEKEKTPLSVQLTPGLKVTQVNYFVGNQQIASSTQAPYDASADLAPFKSGSYDLKAQVVTSDFGAFSSPSQRITLTNSPDDDRLTRLAKEEADRQAVLLKAEADRQAVLLRAEEEKQAKLAKQVGDAAAAKAEQEHVSKEIEANLACFWPRPGFDEKIFRKQAAVLAFSVPERRFGVMGKVHGLSVYTVNGVPQFGAPLTISASVRPGTGQTNFLAFSEEDAKVTAQQAAEYCKTKTSSYHWDWSKYDLTVGYLENEVKNAGGSAGAADALAMMSAIIATPVDTSVAVTGALTLQGQVEPVGGLGLKVESAFADTNVHTVIIPADAVSASDLSLLYMTRPVLCFHRRIVMVRTMDDVMEQALIGWNTDSEVREEKLVQGGLRHFSHGEDKLALAAFAAAKAITPGNWTIDFWTSMVYAVEKQNRDDMAAGLR